MLYCHVICKYVGLTLFVIIKLDLIFVIFQASHCEQYIKGQLILLKMQIPFITP